VISDSLAAALAAMSAPEIAAVGLAIAYLALAIRQNILCWLAALISSFLYLGLFFSARLYMESGLQVFYAAMAVYGWSQWRYGGAEHSGLRITTWSPRRHASVIATILGMTALFGWAMSHTDAVFPFLDSFTTVAAIFATYMVARKVLENWVYWFVIDSLSIYLYLSRGLHLTALLFLLYLVLIVIGFRRWWRDWRAESVVPQRAQF